MNPNHRRALGPIRATISRPSSSSSYPPGPAYEPDELEAGRITALMTQRYHPVRVSDGVIYQQGSDQIYVHNGPRPVIARATRTSQPQPERYTDEMQTVVMPATKKKRRLHWLFFVGLALLTMLLGWIALNAFGSWWQIHNDDATYGRPRTYQMDAVVGHGDSALHPSHFMAENLNRHVVIFEVPGGDISKSIIYSAGELMGENQDLTPITLTFNDQNGDGRTDMIVHIGPQTLVFLNNGTKFVPPTNLVFGGSNPPSFGG